MSVYSSSQARVGIVTAGCSSDGTFCPQSGIVSGGSLFLPETIALLSAMTVTPDAARQILINATISSLKSSGIWAQLDLLYVDAAHDSQAARLNWKTPGSFTQAAVNGPVFVVDRGFTGDGSSSRLNTNFTPSTQATQITQNNASAWVWCVTNTINGSGDIGGSATSNIRLRTSNGVNAAVIINDATTSTVANITSVGLMGISRPSGSTKKVWKNGAQMGADISVASTSLSDSVQWMLGSAPAQFVDRQQAMGAWGAALTGLESSFYNTMLTYMQGVGAA